MGLVFYKTRKHQISVFQRELYRKLPQLSLKQNIEVEIDEDVFYDALDEALKAYKVADIKNATFNDLLNILEYLEASLEISHQSLLQILGYDQ